MCDWSWSILKRSNAPWNRGLVSAASLGWLLRDAFRRGSLVPLATPELDLRRQFYFIWHSQKYQTAAMLEFVEQCRAMTSGVRRSDEINLPPIA